MGNDVMKNGVSIINVSSYQIYTNVQCRSTIRAMLPSTYISDCLKVIEISGKRDCWLVSADGLMSSKANPPTRYQCEFLTRVWVVRQSSYIKYYNISLERKLNILFKNPIISKRSNLPKISDFDPNPPLKITDWR